MPWKTNTNFDACKYVIHTNFSPICYLYDHHTDILKLGGAGDTPPVSSPFSPIACTVPGVSELCMSSSSPMLSDASDGDTGLRAGLPSPPSLRPRPSQVVSSDSPSSPGPFPVRDFRLRT